MTVGEIIASHHARAAANNWVAAAVAFAETDIGKALHRYERALKAAMLLDCTEHVETRGLIAVWEAADKARQELETLIQRDCQGL
jgi:hypothetical protein